MLTKALKLRLVSNESLLRSYKYFLGSYKGFLRANESLEGRVLFTFKIIIILKEFLDSSGRKYLYVIGATGLYALSAAGGVFGYYIL